MKQKRYISIIIALLSILNVTAQQKNNQYALYNYRNDGSFNAWLNIDVDSITYSCFGIDSIEYDHIVTQEVWTRDSVYRIPIAAVDSIGFTAPEPIMASNIFYIRDYHAPYTEMINGRTIQLSKTINRDSIPSVGQVVLSQTEMSPYEEGFAGKVVDVRYGSNQISIECEEVSIGDIYKRLVLVGKVTNDVESNSSLSKSYGYPSDEPWVNIEDYGVIPINLDPISFSIGDLLTVTSPTPKLTCTYYCYISELYYEGEVKLDLYHPDLTYTLSFSLDQLSKYSEFGKLFAATFSTDESLMEWLNEYKQSKIDKYLKEEEEYEKELSKQWFERSKIKIPIPTPVSGVLNLELEISPIVKAKGKLELDSEFKTDAWQSMSMKWKGFTPLKILTLGQGLPDIPEVHVSAHQDPFKSAKLDLKVTGTLTLGFKNLLNVNFIHKDLIYLGLACDVAKEAGLNLDVTLMDTEQPEMNIYDRLKDSNIKVSTYAKGYAEAGLTPYKFLSATCLKMKLYTKEKIYNIFPHFTEPSLPRYNNGTWQGKKPLSYFSYPSKDIFLPCKIGMRIVDEDGKSVREYQDTYRYLDELDWQNRYVDIDVSDLPTGCSYKCYPTISFLGLKPFNAGPHHNFYSPVPLTVSPKELTLGEGETCEAQIFGGWDTFAPVIVEGEDFASVIYNENSDPRKLKIFGKKQGTAKLKIEDRRSKQVAYVSITIGDEPEHEYVDLGLPSGTLWATCNVGANSPEEYGEQYAWGEVNVKNDYSWESYIHCDGTSSTLHDIGINISDTNYDIAHIKWGGGWIMPNNNQIDELYRYCSPVQTTQNGMNGILFTGLNGNIIFLPDCEYWSSNLQTIVPNTAYYWGVVTLSKGRVTNSKPRCYGSFIRPVCIQNQQGGGVGDGQTGGNDPDDNYDGNF